MSLKEGIIKQIQTHESLKCQLMIQFKRTEVTIKRWLKENNKMLETETALKLIEKELGIDRSKIIDRS